MIINNVKSNNILIDAIATSLNNKEVLYNTKHRRLRYNDHVINLTIQVFLFENAVDDYKYLENKVESSFDI